MIVLPRVIVVVILTVAANINFTNASESLINDTLDFTDYRKARTRSVADSCITNDDNAGTCMSRLKCLSYGGTPKGYCASLGVCCEINLQCNANSKLKRIIIKNPSLVNIPDPCVYTIQAYSSNVCQLLIEFQRFELQPPSLANNALECGDNLSLGDFILCGDNTAQHLYVPFNVAQGVTEIPLTFNLPNRWSQSVWRLVITQLECPTLPKRRSLSFMPFVNGNNLQNLRTLFAPQYHSNDLDILAPSGCNQYFTPLSGNIKSFNFKDDGSAFYLSNMNYVICIKPAPGASMIEYQTLKFSVSIDVATNMGYDGDCHSTVQTPGRREDYLMIPQSYVANNLDFLPTYYCGTSLQKNSALLASAPFIIYFSSDGFTDATETGFSINYRMRNVL